MHGENACRFIRLWPDTLSDAKPWAAGATERPVVCPVCALDLNVSQDELHAAVTVI